MKIRTFFAVLLCKLARGLLRLLRRGGTAFPGRVALKVYPQVLGVLSRGVRVILVTGTNGKTTSSRMIEQAFADAGLNYFANRSGANLISGITAEFAMHSTLTGRPKCQFAVIECDEAASKTVLKYLKPEVIVATNVFRDQLDRYGEITHTLNNIIEGIRHTPESTLCINADCSLIASIPEHVPNPVVRFGVNVPLGGDVLTEISDAPHCIHCKTEYVYDYRTYGHLGAFRCPKCGYHRQTPQVAVTKVLATGADSSDIILDIFGHEHEVHVNLPGGYNIYNACAAMTAAKALGLDLTKAAQSLSHFACGFGRMEKFEIGGADVRMILIKNPAGCNQVLSFLTQRTEPFVFAACLNDRTQDGRDVSWIWDVAFERLTDMDALREVYLSGTRAEDMALRFLYAGFPQEKLHVQKDYGKLMEEATAHKLPVFVMPTYTAMLALRGTISKTYGYKQFWE